MKSYVFLPLFLVLFHSLPAQEKLGYHDIRTDARGHIKPWNEDDPGTAFDDVINRVWQFWDTMRTDINGLPYYMNHMVWTPGLDDARGLGGDQLQMALSSWQWLYAYSGNERVKQNMKFIADYYLGHSLTPAGCLWPSLPFSYNTLVFSGTYDGDMILGPGFLQPDKAGSLGLELIHLHKMCSRDMAFESTSARYLDAAISIARSLAAHIQPGDHDHSPLPFKVNVSTGESTPLSIYTSNWSGTMELFLALKELDPGHAQVYQHGFQVLLEWMKAWPLQNNRWGPFFEDVPGWSDTQINAVTFARFIMEHRDYFPDWQKQVSAIFDWVYKMLGNDTWKKYRVTVVNEQSAYHSPGQSHSSRQAAAELLYCSLSHDTTRKTNAIRQLIWSTYMVDGSGRNRYPKDEIWLTDGYGDYIRHFLRSMAAFPELAPPASDHIVSSSSVIQRVDYTGQANKFLLTEVKDEEISRLRVFYRTYDSAGIETIRMKRKPAVVLLDGKAMREEKENRLEGYRWVSLDQGGGVLFIRRSSGIAVTILD